MNFLGILLQLTTAASSDTTGQVQKAADKTKEAVSMMDLIIAGGWAMYPIGLLSIIGFYIIIERIISLSRADKNPQQFLDNLKKMVEQGDVQGAQSYCKMFNSPFSRMIDKGLSKLGMPLSSIEASIENTGKMEVFQLEKNLATLATVSGAGPMLGFLGTVTGMVQAFIAIAQEEGTISPKLLSAGIYEAMVTTVAGLIVGIIAYIGYNYLVGRVQKIMHHMEYASIEFIELLQQPK